MEVAEGCAVERTIGRACTGRAGEIGVALDSVALVDVAPVDADRTAATAGDTMIASDAGTAESVSVGGGVGGGTGADTIDCISRDCGALVSSSSGDNPGASVPGSRLIFR